MPRKTDSQRKRIEKREVRFRRNLDRRLADMTPANRATAARFLHEKAKTVTTTTRSSYANALSLLDRAVNGTPFDQITPTQLTDFFVRAQSRWSPATIQGHAARYRHFW